MRIFIEVLDLRDVEIEVDAEDTIRDVKENIRNILQIPPGNELQFEYQNSILEDKKTVRKYGIKEGAIINVMRKKIQLFARTMDGRTYAIEIQKSVPIQNVKDKIREKTGLSVDQQKLYYQGAKLDDEKSVEDYQIRDKSVINIVARFRIDGMRLFVKMMDGKTVAIEVLKSDSIQNIKEKISDKAGLSVDEQELVYQGAILEDKRTMEDYQFGDIPVINVVTRLWRLFVKTMDGKTVEIWVHQSDSIQNMKEKIKEKTGLNMDEQRLVFQGVLLNDTKTVKYYQIRDGSVINVVVSLRNGMQLFFNMMDGKTVTLEVQISDSILNMKKKIKENTGISVDEQKLVYQGAILDNEKSVEDYQMGDKSVINVVVRLRM